MNIAPPAPITTSDIALHKAAVATFFRGLEEHHLDVCAPLLAEDVVEVIPFSNSGGSAPNARFDGKKAVLGYLSQIMQNFSRTVLMDKRLYAAEDGTVFIEAKGDLVAAKSGAPYNNLYVFKFEFRSNLISHISEYANPVTYAKMAGEPLG